MFPGLPSRFLLAALFLAATAHAMTVDTLRIEYADRPLALDVTQPRLSWVLHSPQRADRQTAYRVLVASAPQLLADERADLWDSGKIDSAENFGILYRGPTLKAGSRYYWQVRAWDAAGQPSAWSEGSWWQMGMLAATDWKAKWVGGAETGSPLLRREFRLEPKKILRATAYAYAAGWYRLSVNGTELTDRVLAPVNSNYPKGLFYDAYDVTALIQPGDNAVGFWLGHGYSQSYSKYGFRWNAPPSGIAQLEIAYTDGTAVTIATDGDWRTAESPIVADDIYNGETYDARREMPRWNTAGFDAAAWRPATVREVPAGPLKSCPFPGLAVTTELKPVKLTEPKPGVFVFDLGQNIAGWVRLRVKGAAGDKVVIRHAEEIHPDGMLDTVTNRLAQATDTYVLRGEGEETYEPRFTYHGFRYVEVTGYPGRPTVESVTGRAVRAAVEETGTFSCSDELVNRMHRNFRWSISNNLVGIPTDTASRDERTPCQMDSLAVEDAAICNFAMNGYYAKWLNDIAGDGGDLPSWSGDQVVLPYLLWQAYGDRRILEQHYSNMKQAVDRFAVKAQAEHPWADAFGDWAPANQPGDYETSFSEGELVARAFFYRSARIMTEVAKALGETIDAERYVQMAEQERAAFEQQLYHPATATYSSGRQVTSVLPLAFDLVTPTKRAAVLAALRQRVEGKDRAHVDAGIFGTRYLFEVLIDAGHADLAYQVLTNPGYPGYPDQIAQGATTTWEQWTYRGSMQTHDHAMFSGPDATFFNRLGGIQAGTPGFREIVIRPAFPTGLTHVRCSQQTMMGKVSSHWERKGSGLVLRISVPANATAKIYVPAASLEDVFEQGKPAAKAVGVLSARLEGNSAVLSVGAGDYEFSMDPRRLKEPELVERSRRD